MNHCDRKTAPTAAATEPTPTLLTSDHPFSAQSCALLHCARIANTLEYSSTRALPYPPRLQLQDFLSCALGSVAVRQEGTGEAGTLPVEQRPAARHQGIKAPRPRDKKTNLLKKSFHLRRVLHNGDQHCICFFYCETFATVTFGHLPLNRNTKNGIQ